MAQENNKISNYNNRQGETWTSNYLNGYYDKRTVYEDLIVKSLYG